MLSEEELRRHDGSDPALPIYLAVDGDVFDVTAGGPYQKGGSYSFFTGRDGARAFATGCFKTHITHDLRGLTPAQIKVCAEWSESDIRAHTHLCFIYQLM